MTTIHGHTQQRAALALLAQQERLPGSLLFTGIKGIGKQLVAYELARQLLCQQKPFGPQGGCNSCQACVLFNSKNHPDLHTITFGTGAASMDDLRETLDGLSLKAFLGGRRVAIINDADEISTIGANLLLKTLEEPRPETFYILLAASPTRLPQTVLSRCQRWFFDRLSPTEIKHILTERGATEVSDSIAALAEGSLCDLETLKDRKELADEVREVLDAAFKGDARRIGRAAQEWGGNKIGVKELLALLRTSIRERLLCCDNDRAAASVWATALQNIIDAEYLAVDRHANPTLVLLTVLRSCNLERASSYQNTPNLLPTMLEELLR